MAETPPKDDPADFELAVDDDLLAAAVAAVEARMAPKPPPAPDPEAEAAFAADLEVELQDASTGDDEHAGPDEDDTFDLLFDTDDEEEASRSTDTGTDVATGGSADSALSAALAAADARAEQLESEITELMEQLEHETKERRRATAIAVRLKERAQRSDLLVTNARNGRAAAEQRIEELEAAIARLEDEAERARERRRREVEDARQQGLAPTLKELLPVLDHLQMAIAHADAEPDKLVEGVTMIAGQFERALASQGAVRVPASPGTPFNPEHHEALERVETDAHPPGSVTAELRAGFLLHGRLLRAARVTVAAGTPTHTESAADAVEMPDPDVAPDNPDQARDTAADTAPAGVDGTSGIDSSPSSSSALTGHPEPDAHAGASDGSGAIGPDPV